MQNKINPNAFQNPRSTSRVASPGVNPRSQPCLHVIASLYEYFHCMNDTQYTKIFDDMKSSLAATRNKELPIFACIIGAYCLFILFGVFGNGLVMLAVCRNRAMRTARNLFIFNLAVSDFILCLLTQPLNILRLFPSYINWEFGTSLCKVVNTLTGVNMFVSTFSITAIALDRFQVIVYPTRTRMERRTMSLCLVAIWGAAGMMASPLALFANTAEHPLHFGSSSKRIICSEITSRIFVKYAKLAYSIGVMIVQYLVPLGIVVAAYARICVRLQHRMRSMKQFHLVGDSRRDSGRHQHQHHQQPAQPPTSSYQSSRQAAEAVRQRRANRLLVTIAIVFGLSWLPLAIVNIVHDLKVLRVKEEVEVMQKVPAGNSTYGGGTLGGNRKQESDLAIAASQSIPLLLVLVSACLNPVFYGWFNENFQAEFHHLLCLNRIARAGPKFKATSGSGQPASAIPLLQPGAPGAPNPSSGEPPVRAKEPSQC